MHQWVTRVLLVFDTALRPRIHEFVQSVIGKNLLSIAHVPLIGLVFLFSVLVTAFFPKRSQPKSNAHIEALSALFVPVGSKYDSLMTMCNVDSKKRTIRVPLTTLLSEKIELRDPRMLDILFRNDCRLAIQGWTVLVDVDPIMLLQIYGKLLLFRTLVCLTCSIQKYINA
jgi:hypothetical protein